MIIARYGEPPVVATFNPSNSPDATDAIGRLCFIAKIEEGLRQSEAGRLVSHEEVKKQFLK